MSVVIIAVFLLALAIVVPVAWFFGRSSLSSSSMSSPFSGNGGGTYDPVKAGEELPDGFRQIVPRDAIRPVYEPVFVPADSAGWDDNIEVIGVFSGIEAKAYPISFLTRWEMVVDELDGLPILVSW